MRENFPPQIYIQLTNKARKDLENLNLLDLFKQQIEDVTHVFMCKLEGQDRETGLASLGMRIPMDNDLGGLQFRILAKFDCALATGASRWEGDKQRWEVDMPCCLSTNNLTASPIPQDWIETLFTLNTRQQEKHEVNKRLKRWLTYLEVLELFIEKKQFQVPFISSRIDSDNPASIHLTLAQVTSAELLNKIKQCRRGEDLSLNTIKKSRKNEIIPLISANLSQKEFYKQHQSNRFFWVIDNSGYLIGYLSSELLENQSQLRTLQNSIRELTQEINLTDIDKISVKFESFNENTRILKVSLDEEYVELINNRNLLIAINGFVANSLIGDLYQIRVQKGAIKRLKEDGGRLPNLDKILYGSNEELALQAMPLVNPIPLQECLNVQRINEHQRLAIAIALASPDCFFLQGPPGTGKTTFISELCYQIARRGGRVIVSSQSNLAVDNALSRLQNHPDILAIRLGESKKVSEDAQDFVGEKAVRRWLRSLAQKSHKNLVEIETKAMPLELFINHWEDISKWTHWQQERSILLTEAENKRAEANKHTEEALTLQSKNSFLTTLDRALNTLTQQFSNNKVIPNYNNELWQRFIQLQISELTSSWTPRTSNPWKIAIELQQQILDAKPGGKVFQFEQDCNSLLQKIESTVLKLKTSLQRQQDTKNSVEFTRIEMGKKQNLEGKFKQILCYGITDESLEVISLSLNYTNISSRLSKAKTFIALLKYSYITNNNSNFFNILSDASQFLTRKINLVQLIRSWEESEINLSPNRLNQYQYISDKLFSLKRLSLLFIVGRLYKPVLSRAEGQLKSSIDMISNASCSFHTNSSILSRKIYQEYNFILQDTEAKTTELRIQHEQELKKFRDEESYFNSLLVDAKPLLNEAKTLHEIFNTISTKVLHWRNTLSLEDLIQICKNLQNMASFAEAHIRNIKNQLVPSFQNALASLCQKILPLQHKYTQLEQSALNRANSLNEESKNIASDVRHKDDKYEVGHRTWKELRVKRAIPPLLDVAIPNFELLSLERNQWLLSVGGETRAKRLKTEIQIQKDWIARIDTNTTEISDELHALFFKCANVIGATCIYTGNKRNFLSHFSEFDAVIVDEVSKATPTELLVPCLLGKKIVLVGDHKQLPPIFGEESCFIEAAKSLGLDAEELRKELSTCLFKERYEYLDNIGASRTLMLTQQYRMHSQIMSAINQFYEGKLTIGYENQDSDRAHEIEIPNWLSKKDHLIWIDLPKNNSNWHHKQVGTGRQNLREAELIISIVINIFTILVKTNNLSEQIEIGITSVYKAQTNLIKGLLHQKNISLPSNVTLSIGTVDEFQGMEKDIMFVSLVLNQPGVFPSEFLRTPERVNVAMSRARKLLIVTGSSHNYVELQTEASPMYGRVLDIAKNHGAYLKVDELVD